MDKFIACMVDHCYEVLIISGLPDPKTLQTAWDNLFYSYCDAMEDALAKHTLELVRAINTAAYRILKIEACIDILRMDHSDICIEVLQAEGHDISPGYSIAELDIIAAWLANDRIDLELLKGELEEVRKAQTGEKVSHEYYARMFFTINKEQGFKAKPADTTVTEYVTAVKIIRDKNKPKANARLNQ